MTKYVIHGIHSISGICPCRSTLHVTNVNLTCLTHFVYITQHPSPHTRTHPTTSSPHLSHPFVRCRYDCSSADLNPIGGICKVSDVYVCAYINVYVCVYICLCVRIIASQSAIAVTNYILTLPLPHPTYPLSHPPQNNSKSTQIHHKTPHFHPFPSRTI